MKTRNPFTKLRVRNRLPVAVLAGLLTATAQAQTGSSYVADKRAQELVRQMTLEEKIDLLSGGSMMGTKALPRLNIPEFRMSDGPMGAHVPAPSTALAAGIGLAASWDPQLAQRIGRQIGRDARSRGAHYLLGPGVNIYRVPLNGRNFEYFGEDPYLASQIAVGYIAGVQSQGVAATIKHFMGNNSEYARMTENSVIGERAMREIYLPVFEAAVKTAHVGAVMDSYNKTNGSYMTENGSLNSEILKKEWGFDGVLMSDWMATHDGVAAVNNGLDLEMPFGMHMNRATLIPAVEAGKVSRAAIDEHVERLLSVAERFGWLDRPQIDFSISRYDEHGNEAALLGAQEGMVLLKNNGLLPLRRDRVRTIAVLGPDAYPAVPTAGGSGYVQPFHAVSILEGVGAQAGPSLLVTYARGVKNISHLSLETPFHTAAAGGGIGVTVETFAGAAASGKPISTRIEASMTEGRPFGSDPENTVDYSVWTEKDFAAIMRSARAVTSTRWTGYLTPEKSGEFDAFVETMGRFRMLIDGKAVMDRSAIAKAALNQISVPLSAAPHQVVVELLGDAGFAGAFLRAGVVAEDGIVDPYAKELARRADVVLIAAGFAPDSETEGADRMFQLPVGQDELIEEIAGINRNTIVAVTSGGSVDVHRWYDKIAGLVELWYPGQEGGTALAEMLLGDIDPSGRLPISWEKRLEDNPSIQSYYFTDAKTQDVEYKEGIFVGYRGYDRNGVEPMFPFGYGLSYTTFRYSNLRIASRPGSDTPFIVSVDVTNTGSRAGSDVAQLYLSDPHAKTMRPLRELKGFERVRLAPAETKTVRIPLDRRALTYFDPQRRSRRADAGDMWVRIGRSEKEIVLEATIRLAAPIDIPVDAPEAPRN